MTKRIAPNVIRGGQAIPLGNNFYYMHGRKHSQGGIDIGKDLEVEGGEVMQMGGKSLKVFSSLPFLNGQSPAQRVMNGENPSLVFNAQERFKHTNKINDDGTRKKALGGKTYTGGSLKEIVVKDKKPINSIKRVQTAGPIARTSFFNNVNKIDLSKKDNKFNVVTRGQYTKRPKIQYVKAFGGTKQQYKVGGTLYSYC